MINLTSCPRSHPAKSTTRRLAAIALVLLATILFFTYTLWTVLSDSAGTRQLTTHIADLDEDGDLDIVRHRVRKEQEFTAFGGATLWLNEGQGQFVARELPNDEYGGGWASAPGDFDGDGDSDLLIYIGYQLHLLTNQSGAQNGQSSIFGAPIPVTPRDTRAQFGALLVGDLDADGQDDAIVAGCCGRIFTVNAGDNTPNFSFVWRYNSDDRRRSSQTTELTALEGLAVGAARLGDLDGDGDLDLFAGIIAPTQVRNTNPADRILLNDGNGNFTDSGQRLGRTDTIALALGDLDGDGDLDAITCNEREATIWMNQGNVQGSEEGVFIAARHTLPSGPVSSVLITDLDNDGKPDALIGQSRQATIWWNDGQASLSRSDQSFRYSREHAIAVGDFDGDSLADIFAGSNENDYRLWLNDGTGTFH